MLKLRHQKGGKINYYKKYIKYKTKYIKNFYYHYDYYNESIH